MPNRSEYQPLAQGVDEEEEADVGEGLSPAPQPPPHSRRPGHIDLGKLDTAFKRWTESIAQKVKRKRRVEDNSRKEILHSVFEPPVAALNIYDDTVKTLDHKPPMTRADFDRLVQAVKDAIADGVHPKMISKGSSGSYFARAKIEGRVQTVAVFKPKDEEPYGRLNPKTTKWLHRQFKWIIPFGRACLIPNLSYISEAAASLLDERLDLHIVPRTELVSLSSPAFFYDWLDRKAAKKGKPLPEKIGSMQYFLHGYTDASDFLRKHPWPGRAISDTFDDSNHRKGSLSKKLQGAVKIVCGKTGEEEDMYDEDDREDERVLFDATESLSGQSFYWTSALQDSFREELEKYEPLLLLHLHLKGGFFTDFLMLNTDRGADNYMIKFCDYDHGKSLVDVAPSRISRLEMPMMTELRRTEPMLSTPQLGGGPSSTPSFSQGGYSNPHLPYERQPHIHIAAIDNSLSFPHEHPRGWRSYTYGWLYLPVTIIGRPFSQKTRDHFLPLLTSKTWWAETTYQLRRLFAVDPDFHPKMFRKQLAVVKGQAWNIVQSLKHTDEGPLELTRRQKVLVWDDEVDLTDDNLPNLVNGSAPSPHSRTSRASISSVPLLKHARSHSSSDFPPPIRRISSEFSRPVSFATKFSRVHPATTGVTVLEHMERLDAVEAGLSRLGVEESVVDESEEADVGEASTSTSAQTPKDRAVEVVADTLSPSARSERLPAVPEDMLSASMTEEDLIAMSKSTSQLELSASARHARWPSFGAPPESRSRPSLDWMHQDVPESPKQRLVIVERLETVDSKPFFSCW
ncbi:uncharacterized protein FIBRA_07937 [Fibroporia radiculosa]|uniref:Phosphatidylinositol 4-kinase n=1 Tax=Fibroporia radiculosa TaxID=599839 RepID=J4GVV9_9APHY|nr:uncharacterized protein FIBRA_07937 [Fibroporia radiculosa]CCM05705.1 predicted protein [Fibroporia radiculosa]